MFTKDDYRRYFEDVAMTERAMVYQVNDVIAGITDNEVKKKLGGIVSDEMRHYAAMMSVLDTILLKDESQKRSFAREHALGKVRLKGVSSGREFHAYCVNVSAMGMCIELGEALPEQEEYEVEIVFYDALESFCRKGGIRWSARISPAFYMVGIGYRAGLEFGA